MKVAILQCDDVLQKFQNEFGNYPAMIEQMFEHGDDALSFETFDCQAGELPPDIKAYDFYITTGSKVSVYDGLAWVDRLIAFIQKLDANHIKLIGVCFGHQLIAMARGVKVEKSAKGWGIGIAHNQVIDYPRWMNGRPKEFNILASHQDQITNLPDDAVIIAKSDFCPYFVVQWSAYFLSIQGHPEWSPAYSLALMNNRRAIIPAEIIEQGIRSLAIEPDNKMFASWIISFVLDYNHD